MTTARLRPEDAAAESHATSRVHPMHCTASVISAFMTTYSDGIEPLTAIDFNLLWVEVQLRESFLRLPSFCVCVGESSGTTLASVALGRVLVSVLVLNEETREADDSDASRHSTLTRAHRFYRTCHQTPSISAATPVTLVERCDRE